VILLEALGARGTRTQVFVLL